MARQRDIQEFLTFKIVQLHHALDAQAVEILRSVGSLTQGQWRVLSTVGAGMASASREVARLTTLDPAMISRTLRVLERDGLVTTRRAESDRRILEIVLTEKGRQAYERTLPHMRARQTALLDALDPQDRVAVFRIIDMLQGTVDKQGR